MTDPLAAERAFYDNTDYSELDLERVEAESPSEDDLGRIEVALINLSADFRTHVADAHGDDE